MHGSSSLPPSNAVVVNPSCGAPYGFVTPTRLQHLNVDVYVDSLVQNGAITERKSANSVNIVNTKGKHTSRRVDTHLRLLSLPIYLLLWSHILRYMLRLPQLS